MAAVYRVDATHVAFRCPGCKTAHAVNIGPGGWMFNGDFYSRPTFSPSMLMVIGLMVTGHYVPGHTGSACWCTYNAEHPNRPAPVSSQRCHSFVTDGKIHFLDDSTHALAGQTVNLPHGMICRFCTFPLHNGPCTWCPHDPHEGRCTRGYTFNCMNETGSGPHHHQCPCPGHADTSKGESNA